MADSARPGVNVVVVLLTPTVIDDARAAWRDGLAGALAAATPTEISLGGALEAASWACSGGDEVRSLVERWVSPLPLGREALALLAGPRSGTLAGGHDAPVWEVRHSPLREELAGGPPGDSWTYFRDRFGRSCQQRAGLSREQALKLATALEEMADNVASHAGDGARGLVGYRVGNGGQVSFSIVDIGRGVRASLADNPAHAAIATDAAALESAVRHHASSRMEGPGTGFTRLVVAVSNLNARLTFRSDTARLTADGTGVGDRVWTHGATARMAGFQLVVVANPKNSIWSA